MSLARVYVQKLLAQLYMDLPQRRPHWEETRIDLRTFCNFAYQVSRAEPSRLGWCTAPTDGVWIRWPTLLDPVQSNLSSMYWQRIGSCAIQ
jgi:hypothetical protein